MSLGRAKSSVAYIHGTDPDEQARLSKLNQILNELWVEEIQPSYGSRILDVGSGLGQFTARMVRQCRGTALGIEVSDEQRLRAIELSKDAVEAGAIEFRAGDVLKLPLNPDERGTFDLVHGRFILEHVTEPLRVVHQMVGALKPRGRIILMDDDHEMLRLYPEPPEFMTLWAAYSGSYVALGNDPNIGRKLPDLIHRAGALPTRASMIFFGGCKGMDDFELLCDNILQIIRGAADLMLEHELATPTVLERGISEFMEWRTKQSANMLYAFPWAEGISL